MSYMTNVRAGRATALLLKNQGGKGTLVDDFSSGTVVPWTESVEIGADPEHSAEDWMSSPLAPDQAEQYNKPYVPAGRITVLLDPDLLDIALRSNWGDLSAGDYLLGYQVADDAWMTFGWVENIVPGGPGRFVRAQDVWFHKIMIFGSGPQGPVMAHLEWAGRDVPAPADLAALPGGVVLPASYAKNPRIFDMRSASAFLIIGVSTIPLPIADLSIVLDQRLYHEYDQMARLYETHKLGRTTATFEVTTRVTDNSWLAILASIAGDKNVVQVSLVAQTPPTARNFTFRFNAITLKATELGHDGQDYRYVKLAGRALIDSGGDFVRIFTV